MIARFLTFLMLLSAATLRAEVHYFSSDSVSVNLLSGICAVEARAENQKGEWLLTWPGVEISVNTVVSNFVDGIDEPLAIIRCNSKEVKVKGLDSFGGYNTVAVEWNVTGGCSILCGADLLKPIMQFDSLPKPKDYIRVVDAKSVAYIVIETNPDDFARLVTDYSEQELAETKIWRYLDRESDPKIALPGGHYILGQIGNDLIYIAGAQINAAHWHKGMLKGRMTPTGYVGYYRLQWYDATGRTLHDESFVQFDDATSTMTITFPELQASLRFTSLTDGGVSVGGE